MPSDDHQSIADGQFDNVQDNLTDPPAVDPRQGGHFVDDENLLEWSEDSESDDKDSIDEGYDDNRVEDEDWEIAEGGM